MVDLPAMSDDEIILLALDRYAQSEERLADMFGEGSSAWAECVRRAQRANQLYVQRSTKGGR